MTSGFQPDIQGNTEANEDNNVIANMNLYKRIVAVWMFCHAQNLPNIPMWVGFNSMIMRDNSPQQSISYLTPINSSPTAIPVVLATMDQSLEILKELNQPYIQVKYDLAIAKIALKLQATEKHAGILKYSKLFIHLGALHVMLSYFKAIGKIIDGCGLSTIMVESKLLASASVLSFLEGKHFNRCKRLHPMMALGESSVNSVKRLNFTWFM